ncbi:MAG: hypothetical protein M0Z66_02140 [Thermaerobacter sp.]|nr:hypothetical protein [Thermaerobacter sp.]
MFIDEGGRDGVLLSANVTCLAAIAVSLGVLLATHAVWFYETPVIFMVGWIVLLGLEGQIGWLTTAVDYAAAFVLSMVGVVIPKRRQRGEKVGSQDEHIDSGCAGWTLVRFWRTETGSDTREKNAQAIRDFVGLICSQEKAETAVHKVNFGQGQKPGGSEAVNEKHPNTRKAGNKQACRGTGGIDEGDLARVVGVWPERFSSYAEERLRETDVDGERFAQNSRCPVKADSYGKDLDAAQSASDGMTKLMNESTRIQDRDQQNEFGDDFQRFTPSILWRMFPFVRLAVLLALGAAAGLLMAR